MLMVGDKVMVKQTEETGIVYWITRNFIKVIFLDQTVREYQEEDLERLETI